ncbi:hypothetical protein EGO55_12165 [Caenibius tardaugens NBRC 16725]|nr:hypothetical protein EGO55_12165 [Caenibius tardaugens NBRC 16725]
MRWRRHAWNDSGKVYGYRKLHDDLLDQGKACSGERSIFISSQFANRSFLQANHIGSSKPFRSIAISRT